MDSNTEHANQSHRKYLTLEARHSISIEAANKIRSELTPRIFMPRAPLHQNTNKYKTFLKSKMLPTKESHAKYEIETVQNFVKRLKNKIEKKTHTAPNSNTLVNKKNKRHNFRTTNTNVYQNIKVLRKKTKKMQMAEQHDKLSAAKERNIRNGAKEHPTDSTRYTAYGEIIFLVDHVTLNSPQPLRNDETTSLQTLVIETAVQNATETGNKNNLNLTISQSPKEDKLSGSAGEKKRTSDTQASNVAKSSYKSTKQDLTEAFDTKSSYGARSDMRKHSKKVATKSLPILTEINAINESLHNFSSHTSIKTTWSNFPLTSPAMISAETSKGRTNDERKTSSSHKGIENNSLGMQTTVKHPVKSIAKKENQQSIIKTTRKQSVSPTFLATTSTTGYLKRCLYRYFHTITNAVTEFQDAVKSSISLIYDCSQLDITINEDLMELENSVDIFSKYVLQSYDNAAHEELKTITCTEYLNKKYVNGMNCTQQSMDQIPFLNQPNITDSTSDSLTIFIEVDEMPKQSITFKTSDILKPKLISNKEEISQISALSLNMATQMFDNTTGEYSETICNSTQCSSVGHCELAANVQNTMNMQKNNISFTRVRKKLTPKHVKPSVLTPQAQTPPKLTTSASYNAYNLNHPKLQNQISYSATDSLRLPFSSTNNPGLITNCPITIANYCNHRTAGDLGTDGIPITERRSNFNRGLRHVPNENTNRLEYHSSFSKVPRLQNHYIHHALNSQTYNNSQWENDCGMMGNNNSAFL